MHLPTRDAQIVDPIGRWATNEDLPSLTQFGHSESVVRRRLESGDRAWIAVESRQLMAYCWFTSGLYRDTVSGLEFRGRQNEVWLYDAMVNRADRGRGLYPRLLSGAALRLRDEGIFGIWIVVEVLNRNSIRAHEGAGAVAKKNIRVLSLLGRQVLWQAQRNESSLKVGLWPD